MGVGGNGLVGSSRYMIPVIPDLRTSMEDVNAVKLSTLQLAVRFFRMNWLLKMNTMKVARCEFTLLDHLISNNENLSVRL